MATLDKLGENHDVDLAKAKERIFQDTNSLKQAQAIHSNVLSQHASHENCTNECHEELISSTRKVNELKKTFHPGFVISFDNIDVQLQRKNMTIHSQNQDFHWVNHQMVKNRVSGVQLDSLKPKANVQEVSNLKFIPSIEDQQQQRTNYIILTSRILVQYLKVLQPLKEACIQHIPHKYMAEMSQKSKKVINYYSTFYIPFVPEAREMHLAKFMATVHFPIMISSVFTMKIFKSIIYWL